METLRLTASPLRWILSAVLLTAGAGTPAPGQISTLNKVLEAPAPAKPTAAEKPEETRNRLEQWLREARDALARLDAPGATAALPEGITAEALEERRRDLEQLVLTTLRSFKNLTAISDARKELESARAADAAWTGFNEPAPYSLLMIDELLNERDALLNKLASHESSLANSESLLANSMADTKAAEEALSTLILTLQHATGPALEAGKWRLEAARAKSRVLAVRAGFIQSRCESLKDRITAVKTGLSLLDRQVKIAKANCRFNHEDLAKVTKASESRKQALQKELLVIAKRLKAAMTGRAQAQAALDAVMAQPSADPKPDAAPTAKFRLEVAEGQVEAMQSLGESLESLLQLESVGLLAYQNRQAIISATNPQDRAKALDSLGMLRERLWAWENVIDDENSDCAAALDKCQSQAAASSSEDPRFNLLNDLRTVTSEKLAMLQRLAQAVAFQRKLVKRWHLEYAPAPPETGPWQRLATLTATATTAVKKIWSFEVMSFEDKIEVDGQTITGNIPVTLGMLLRALLFFAIGYAIASRIGSRIQRSLVTRGHVADAQARTLRNWAMIVVGVFLAIATLSFLKIPLTVFAFFGGALAIGLGFGMQTLIKNFISGIIVLVERKVRVGDTLDVEGIIGTVTEINTRSSIIRSPDDVETMIPNSLFLENRVTNWTLSSAKMRRHLRVGVAYGSPPQKVMEILTEAAGRHGRICKHPEPFAVFEDFGESALIFSLYFWLDLNGGTNAMIVTSDLRLMIEKRLPEAGISLPFPQRDVHLATDQPLQVQWTREPDPNTSPLPMSKP